VLKAISGPDAGDVASVPSRLDFDALASVQGLRVGYFPGWMKEPPATDVDRAASRLLEDWAWRPSRSPFPTGPMVRST